jgi:nitric oxide reductase NorQ protein
MNMPTPIASQRDIAVMPWYLPVADEIALFEHCYRQQLAMMLKGPTGCGKSRFVEHMAARLKRPLVTVSCHEDTSASDLLGRYLVAGGDTVWVDGPVTRAVRQGAILYLDEFAEARSDVLVILHALTDHRRTLFLERHDELLTASASFMLAVSYNPGYQHGLRSLKPSTRQRFVGMTFAYPEAEVEQKIVEGETKVESGVAKKLVSLAHRLRKLDELGLAESASTRLLVDAAKLIGAGMPARRACHAAIVEPLSDDAEVLMALREVVDLVM